MTRIYVGPTAVYDLGQVGELSLLDAFEGTVVIPEPVGEEVTTEPASTNLAEFVETNSVETATPSEGLETARNLLGVEGTTAQVAVLAGVLADRDPEDRTAAAVVSEDQRLRRLAEGLSASVTSSFGVVVRAAVEDKYLKRSQAKRIVRRMDQHGLHMTGEVREEVLGEMQE